MAVDPQELRNAFGTFMTGVTVVTTVEPDGTPRGFTANSFSSVSLDPPLLLICVAKSAFSLDVFAGADGFAINILAESQIELSNLFASKEPDKFEKSQWHTGPAGHPVLEGVVSWFDCVTQKVVDAGDHIILIGHVQDFGYCSANPLGYARCGYVTLDLERQIASQSGAHQVVVGALVEYDGGILVAPGNRDGALTLPSSPLQKGAGSIAQTERIFSDYGLDATLGFLFSVFEDRSSGVQNIFYLSAANSPACTKGEFVPLGDLDLDRFENEAFRRMLARYRRERNDQQFGVYFGAEEGGEVRKFSSRQDAS